MKIVKIEKIKIVIIKKWDSIDNIHWSLITLFSFVLFLVKFNKNAIFQIFKRFQSEEDNFTKDDVFLTTGASHALQLAIQVF